MFLPETSCLCIVVIVDIGDDVGKTNNAGSVWVLIGSSRHTKGCPLLDT